jgi:hypothetical protein
MPLQKQALSEQLEPAFTGFIHTVRWRGRVVGMEGRHMGHVELMRRMPPPTASRMPSRFHRNQVEGTAMTTTINMLAIDLAKGSFQVCAMGPEGTVLSNRSLSRTRLATLLAEQQRLLLRWKPAPHRIIGAE